MMWAISVDGEERGGRRGNVAFFVSTTNVKSERKNWGPMENTFPRPFRSGKD
jgi:hypothetical protein